MRRSDRARSCGSTRCAIHLRRPVCVSSGLTSAGGGEKFMAPCGPGYRTAGASALEAAGRRLSAHRARASGYPFGATSSTLIATTSQPRSFCYQCDGRRIEHRLPDSRARAAFAIVKLRPKWTRRASAKSAAVSPRSELSPLGSRACASVGGDGSRLSCVPWSNRAKPLWVSHVRRGRIGALDRLANPLRL